jgi:hypothetical protein
VIGLHGYTDAELNQVFELLRGLRLAAGDFTDPGPALEMESR